MDGRDGLYQLAICGLSVSDVQIVNHTVKSPVKGGADMNTKQATRMTQHLRKKDMLTTTPYRHLCDTVVPNVVNS